MKFKEFALLKLNFDLNDDFKVEDTDTNIEMTPEITMSHQFIEEKKQLVVVLGLRQLTGNIPYRFEIKAGSLFQFANIPEENILKQLATINCPAIIFPYVRETIADLTRRAGFPPLHLDPINFIQLAKEREIQQKKKVGESEKIAE
ncbi:MAG: hypothetical protein A2Y97_12800 [Nitrospirae bacterium RBG_13_39_12]|nr:MAG: hypothetical protein A2Y97_12800 [Nitrospirae bacterium RBG_13_39_12]